MQGSLDAGAIIFAKLPNALHNIVDFDLGDFVLAQVCLVIGVARFGPASQVQDDFEQLVELVSPPQRFANVLRQHIHQDFKVIGGFVLHTFSSSTWSRTRSVEPQCPRSQESV